MSSLLARSTLVSSVIGALTVTVSGIPRFDSILVTHQPHESRPAVRHQPVAARQRPDTAVRARISAGYWRLPLSFEANRGQTDSRVDFVARASGYTLFLTASEAVLVTRSRATHQPTITDARPGSASVIPTQARVTPGDTESVLRMQLVGANAAAHAEGREELPGKVHYFRGNDPGRWWTGISTYGKVQYRNLYPGIDLVYYGNQQHLEYDFIVAPGADPSVIALRFRGADALQVDGEGNLVLGTDANRFVQQAPRVYQEIDGVRKTIAGRYAVHWTRASTFVPAHQVVRFEVGEYDRDQTLVIDPVLLYSTYLGGVGEDDGWDIAVDATGNAYVAGRTASSNFPTTAQAFETASDGFFDAFVTKLDKSGTALVYSTYFGGSDSEIAVGIALDGNGGAYVTGGTGSNDFPTTPGAFDTTFGAYDAFFTKLDASGALAYSTYLGGSGGDEAAGIAVDSAGDAYITGTTGSSDFPTSAGAFDTSFNGVADAFVTKLQWNGAALVYSTYLGGAGSDSARAIALDADGGAYVGGTTDSTDFPTTPGAFDTTYGGGDYDAFATRLDAQGAALPYSTFLGGTASDIAFGIAVDIAGEAYVTGETSSRDFPTTAEAFDTTSNGSFDAFVTKIDRTGATLVYSTYLGGGNLDIALGIAVDGAGSAYVTGGSPSFDFPITRGAFDTLNDGSFDAFVTKLDPTGAALQYSTFLGGTGEDSGRRIALDSSGNAYVTGYTYATDFPTTPASFDPAQNGARDSFVSTINAHDPLVSITTTSRSATEADSSYGTFTIARTGTTAAHLTVQYLTSGTATPGRDYMELSGIVTIPAGASSTRLFVVPVNDTIVEATETVVVRLKANPEYVLGVPRQGTVSIISDEKPRVTVRATDGVATELGTTTGTFTLARTGSTSAPLTVRYTISGTATEASDYVPIKRSATIAAGSSATSVVITAVDDALVEADETVVLTLNTSAAYVIGAARSATATIVSDD